MLPLSSCNLQLEVIHPELKGAVSDPLHHVMYGGIGCMVHINIYT